jgi:hypothetical protein
MSRSKQVKAVLKKWQHNQISLVDAAVALYGLGWNIHEAWAYLEAH